MLEMLTIRPQPREAISGAQPCESRKTARRFTATVPSNSSTVKSSKSVRLTIAALFTSTSTFTRLLEHPAALERVGEIGADRRDAGLALLLQDIDTDHFEPLPGERSGDCSPDTACAAGHERPASHPGISCLCA